MEKSEMSMPAGHRNGGTPSGGGGGGRSRSRIGMVHSQPGSRSTSPTSLRSYHTYYDAQQGHAAAGVSRDQLITDRVKVVVGKYDSNFEDDLKFLFTRTGIEVLYMQ